MKRRRSSRSPITVWSPISIRRCRNCRRNSIKSSAERLSFLIVRRWYRPPVRRKTVHGARSDSIMAANIQNVGVVGAGQMGNGIAHVCALAGFNVVLNDVSGDRLKASLATINGNMAKQVAKKIITEDDRKAALARIKSAGTYEGLGDCDLVI